MSLKFGHHVECELDFFREEVVVFDIFNAKGEPFKGELHNWANANGEQQCANANLSPENKTNE